MAIYLGPNLRYVHGVGIVPLSPRAASAAPVSPCTVPSDRQPARLADRLEDVFAQRWSR